SGYPRTPTQATQVVELATDRAPDPPEQPIRGEASEGGRSPPPRFLAAEVQTLDLRICQQRGPRPLEAVSPELQRVGAVGDGERARRVLLDQHQRVPGALHLPELVEHQRDELRREPE